MKNTYIHVGDESPYFDDYDSSKNYMRIMYNPGRAVQARELTQSQTILQDQLAAAGSFFYKDGTPVSGGRISVSFAQPFMKVESMDVDGQPIDVNLLVGKTFKGNTSQQQITVTDCDDINRYIFFSYLGGPLTDGESFISTTTPTKTFYMTKGSASTAIIAHCDSGKLFINGFYITIPESSIVVAANEQSSLYNIGYKIESEFITSGEDSSLNDNAAGSTNVNAPGADRYKLSASLFSFKGDTPPDNIKFIAGVAIRNKQIIKEQDDPLKDSALMDLLAKRTYDESGSYTVSPWKVQIKEHDTDLSKYIVSIQEGSGYIQGYNVETYISTDIVANKSRSFITKDDINIFNTSGLYTYALFENNVLSASIIPAFNSDTIEVTTEKNGAGTVIGECRISGIYKENSKLLIYLYNASGVINGFNGARSLRSKTNPENYINLYVDEFNYATLMGQEEPYIIKSGYSTLKSIEQLNIEYESIKRYNVTSEATNNTITLIDSNINVDFLSSESLLAVFSSTGTQLNISNLSVTPNNSSTTSVATIQGPDIVNGTEYTVIIRVRYENLSSRTKTLQTNTETVTIQSGVDSIQLVKEDIFDIVSITQLTNIKQNITIPDLKNNLSFDNGQTDYSYNKGSLSGFNSNILQSYMENSSKETSYSITYRYFEHSGIGPFTVSSYMSEANKSSLSDIPDLYTKIPVYTSTNNVEYKLADCLDFRVKQTDMNSYTVPSSKTELKFNADIYLPRYDSVYVTRSGDFGISEGIPSENPVIPSTKEGTMVLYNLYNSAYGIDLTSITPIYIDNRRYTMRDIGKLETRIANVESAISLTQLESSAVNYQILDSEGLNKYKTGIFTDSFSSFDNSDFTNKEWDCTIDSIEQSVRANFNAENYLFTYNENSQNITKSGALVHLPYTTEVYAKNTAASDTVNVQKLMFYVWNGALKLTPSVDTWVNDLGQFVVSETYVDTPQPPTAFRTWNSTYYTGTVGRDRYQHTTKTSETTTYNSSTWELNQTIIDMESQDEFMRERDVEYSLTGMRQGTTVRAFLDKTELALSNNKIDSDGNLTGTFTIPPKIPVGTKQVTFTDDADTTEASAEYTARGKTIWQEITNTYIRKWIPTITTTSTTSSKYLDPVAQSFLVSEAQGIYLDSIDVYFKSKDSSMNVSLYIVEMENGYPSQRMLPFSMVSLTPENVYTSDDATIPTKFKFECPIYLQGNSEYAFVIATSSYEYSVFVSTLGQKDIHTNIGIYEQPFTGSMFLSQNASTWTAEQQSDITFVINRCVFDTNVTGYALFDLQIPENDMNVAIQTLVSNDYILDGTSVKYEYKWNTDSSFTEYENREDVFLTKEKTISNGNTSSLQIRMTLNTNNDYLTPTIDTEQIYGVFCNNIVQSTTDYEYPYIAGTYISKTTTLKYPSEDIRVMLDAILPNNSDVDVYVKSNVYNPIYVVQSTNGNLGVDTASGVALDGQVVQLYYYNNTEKQLEPKSQVELTGYKSNGRKVYLRAVGNPDEFKNISSSSENDTQYIGLDTKYTHLLLIPVFSSVNISLDNWNSENTYNSGEYVIYNGEIWVSLRDVSAGQIPSDIGISWKKINSIKTISVIKTDEEIIWRKMKKDEVTNTSLEKQSQFIEYSYYPEIDIESEFKQFSIKLVLKSKDKINVPRVRNLRAIATI